jgi:orotate phosphoribosyltransferase
VARCAAGWRHDRRRPRGVRQRHDLALAQDLLDLLPFDVLEQVDVVAGPATGGALLAHTMAGLLDGRRA